MLKKHRIPNSTPKHRLLCVSVDIGVVGSAKSTQGRVQLPWLPLKGSIWAVQARFSLRPALYNIMLQTCKIGSPANPISRMLWLVVLSCGVAGEIQLQSAPRAADLASGPYIHSSNTFWKRPLCHATDTSRRTSYWQYNDQMFPGLTDVFGTIDGHVVSVLNIRDDYCSTCGSVHWSLGSWTCVFPAGRADSHIESAGHVLGGDPHQHTLVVKCPLPTNFSVKSTMTLQGAVANRTATYVNVTFSAYESSRRSRMDGHIYHLVACTQVNAAFSHLLPEWVAYHLRQGFQHIRVYANGNVRHVRWLMQHFVTLGRVEVIDWDLPMPRYKSFIHQQSQENSCIQRYRHRAEWVGLMDVDEYFQPVGVSSNMTVASWLRRQPNTIPIGGFQFKSFFFGSAPDELQQVRLDALSQVTFGRYQFRAAKFEADSRQKCIVRPDKVDYFSVHMITSGGEMRYPDALHDMRLAHFKLPSRMMYNVLDSSFAEWASLIDQDLDDMELHGRCH